jgi:hypothetical protein
MLEAVCPRLSGGSITRDSADETASSIQIEQEIYAGPFIEDENLNKIRSSVNVSNAAPRYFQIV